MGSDLNHRWLTRKILHTSNMSRFSGVSSEDEENILITVPSGLANSMANREKSIDLRVLMGAAPGCSILIQQMGAAFGTYQDDWYWHWLIMIIDRSFFKVSPI
jgi:hypothetical protein